VHNLSKQTFLLWKVLFAVERANCWVCEK